jgi:hypothetical protein
VTGWREASSRSCSRSASPSWPWRAPPRRASSSSRDGAWGGRGLRVGEGWGGWLGGAGAKVHCLPLSLPCEAWCSALPVPRARHTHGAAPAHGVPHPHPIHPLPFLTPHISPSPSPSLPPCPPPSLPLPIPQCLPLSSPRGGEAGNRVIPSTPPSSAPSPPYIPFLYPPHTSSLSLPPHPLATSSAPRIYMLFSSSLPPPPFS